MLISEILDKAGDLLAGEGKWTQGAYSRDSEGKADLYEDPEEPPIAASNPACWCALGAIAVACDADPMWGYTFSQRQLQPAGIAMNYLAKTVSAEILVWNDTPERTQSEVVAAFRAAAAKAREEGK